MRPFSSFHFRSTVAPALVSLGLAIGSLAAAPSASAALIPSPQLTLSLSGSPSPVASGTNLTYTITLSNPMVPVKTCELGPTGKPSCTWDLAPGTINAIVVNDALPSGVVFQSVNATNGFACTLSGSQLTCTNGSIVANGTASIAIVVSAPTLAPGGSNMVLTNSVSVSPGSETASVQTTDKAPPAPVSLPDQTITSFSGPAHLSPSQPGTYTLKVANIGQAPAPNTNLRLETQWGGWVTRLSSTSDNGSNCFAPLEYIMQIVECQGGAQAVNTTSTVNISIQAPPASGTGNGTVVKACVNWDRWFVESNYNNNCATVFTSVY